MIVGIPKEIKAWETRVALTPAAVRELVAAGVTIKVEAGAGDAAGFEDAAYAAAGAAIVAFAAQAFDADLVVKVKEIQPGEWQRLSPGGMLFSFLHLGADPTVARELLNRRITGIAFETVGSANHAFPILAPMSAIAGEMAIPIAANLLRLPEGTRGMIFRDAAVLIVGAGVAGTAAARAAVALGAKVGVVSRSDRRLAKLRAEFGSRIGTLTIATTSIPALACHADVVIGAVNLPGEATPKLLSRADMAAMRPGAVLVEISIDGGGIAATSRPTTHAAPIYVTEGVIHYCVPNMPAAVPRSASLKLSEAVLPFVKALTRDGLLRAMRENEGLASGLHMHGGHITHPAVAAQLGLPCLDLDGVLFFR